MDTQEDKKGKSYGPDMTSPGKYTTTVNQPHENYIFELLRLMHMGEGIRAVSTCERTSFIMLFKDNQRQYQ